MRSQALSELTPKLPTGYSQAPVGHQEMSLIKQQIGNKYLRSASVLTASRKNCHQRASRKKKKEKEMH